MATTTNESAMDGCSYDQSVDLECYEQIPDSEDDVEEVSCNLNTSANDDGTEILHTSPSQKRRRLEVDPHELSMVRRCLYNDSTDRPRKDTFYVGGMKIDMNDPETCVIQSRLLGRIFNGLLKFSKCEFKDRTIVHRNLAWEAEQTRHRLRQIKANNYKNAYVSVPSAVSYVLLALEDIKHLRNEDVLYQLVPLTCAIFNNIRERLYVHGMELRTVNNSKSLSVNLSMDVKFIYVGHFQKKTFPEKGDKWFITPTPCLGNYLNVAVSDLYDLIYTRTRQYIKKFFEKNPDDPPAIDAFNSNEQSRQCESNDASVLRYLLRTVGRQIRLTKLDLDRTNVFVLTSAIRAAPKYLNTSGHCGTIDSTPALDVEAVFLSSFTRARIMEDGSLNLQIYSKACMYTGNEDTFPKDLGY